MGLVTALSIDIQHNSIEYHYAECHYAQCRDYLNVMLSVVMLSVVRLNVVILSVVRLNVVMLSVAARLLWPSTKVRKLPTKKFYNIGPWNNVEQVHVCQFHIL
jgi:hypothetical protein